MEYFLQAYIDPGTGAIVLQIIVAAFLACGIMFRRVFVSPFAKLFGKSQRDRRIFSANDDEVDVAP